MQQRTIRGRGVIENEVLCLKFRLQFKEEEELPATKNANWSISHVIVKGGIKPCKENHLVHFSCDLNAVLCDERQNQ